MSRLRARQRLGKYRITRWIAEGAFSTVYEAFDTVASVAVAMKVPNVRLLSKDALEDFRREVRISAKLDHPNILPVKDAGIIGGTFVVIYPLGQESLSDRMNRRMSVPTVVTLSEQMLEGVAFAHKHRIMHCDIKPDNFIIFSGNRIRLADFGIAKMAARTLAASGSGTVGYIAPEQAMGKPSLRSDVFSLGLIFYHMLAGALPEWPFHWPPPGYDRLRKLVHRDVIAFLQRTLQVESARRFADAGRMLAAFKRIKSKALRSKPAKRARRKAGRSSTADWRTIRQRQFLRLFRQTLEARHHCPKCEAPISEPMPCCPWCAATIAKWRGDSRFQKQCPRCNRGVKSDWRFCPWCFGGTISESTTMRYEDARYVRRCRNSDCTGQWLMPFMRYCPWCRQKVRQPWNFEGSTGKCPRCSWGTLPDFWDHCPWCSRNLR
jgi:serine/threonine-protein kinase